MITFDPVRLTPVWRHGLEQFVHDNVHYNGQRIGLAGYREMLEKDF